MLTPNEAVKAAHEYMKQIYGDSVLGLRVEEIEFDDMAKRWNVTMGFWEFLPEQPTDPLDTNALLKSLQQYRKSRRAYKQLSIDGATGHVLSMKIRVLPTLQ